VQPDPRSWRPQAFGRRKPKQLVDPIVEPSWDGIRILAHAARDEVRLVDVEGFDLAADHPEIVAELASAAADESLVVDGFLTAQALRPSVGIDLGMDAVPGVSEQVTQLFLGKRAADYVGGRAPVPGQSRGGTIGPTEGTATGEPVPVAFVAVDLLAIDDEVLLEIPLLERKRLLESVLPEGERVRRTPFVREPAGTFIRTWRSLGFGRLAYKEANSRYRPGTANDAWSLMDMPRR
jgi:ATP-dependent DNA ligase